MKPYKNKGKGSLKYSLFKKYLIAIFRWVKRHHWQLLVALGCTALVLVNAVHESYPDEFENIMGGRFILTGKFPYVDWFTHHAPGAYLLSSVLSVFTGQSFFKFRLAYGIFQVVYLLVLAQLIKKKFGKNEGTIFLVTSISALVMATYTWSHMLLADSLAGLLLLPGYATVLFTALQRKALTPRLLVLISVSVSAAVLTSLTYLFAVVVIYLFTLYLYVRLNKHTIKKWLQALVIMLAPYILFLLYLAVTGSLQHFYDQAVYFNQAYYAKAPDGTRTSNPLRFSAIIFNEFSNNYFPALTQVKDFNLSAPFSATLALGSAVLITYLILEGFFSVAVFIFLLLVFVNARSNPLTTKETDYQAAVYHFISLLNMFAALHLLWAKLATSIKENKKLIYSALLILLSVYVFFFLSFLTLSALNKAHEKYMGRMPLIYDRPNIAPLLNGLLEENDSYIILPFAFEEYLYMNNYELGTRYIVTIPAMAKSEKIQQEMIDQLNTNQPAIIVFDLEYGIFGQALGLFVRPLLQEKYITINQLQDSGQTININKEAFGEFVLADHVFFRQDRADEFLNKLESQGYISR